MEINRGFVDLIICFAYNENDLLVYSSPCITIAALAIDIRFRRGGASFDDILRMVSLSSLKEEVLECSKILHDKLKNMKYFSQGCCHDALDVSSD